MCVQDVGGDAAEELSKELPGLVEVRGGKAHVTDPRKHEKLLEKVMPIAAFMTCRMPPAKAAVLDGCMKPSLKTFIPSTLQNISDMHQSREKHSVLRGARRASRMLLRSKHCPQLVHVQNLLQYQGLHRGAQPPACLFAVIKLLLLCNNATAAAAGAPATPAPARAATKPGGPLLP